MTTPSNPTNQIAVNNNPTPMGNLANSLAGGGLLASLTPEQMPMTVVD